MTYPSDMDYIGDVSDEQKLNDARRRIESLEEDNEVLRQENDKLMKLLAVNDLLPEHYDITDDATVEFAVDLAQAQSDLREANAHVEELQATVHEAGRELVHIASALEIAKNRREINLIIDAIKDLSKSLPEK